MARRSTENKVELGKGTVPLEDMQGWFDVLGEDDPEGTAYNSKEIQAFFDTNMSKSAAEAVVSGMSFEDWFDDSTKKLNLDPRDFLLVKPKFEKAFLVAQEAVKELREENN
jgi:hypothetical protein